MTRFGVEAKSDIIALSQERITASSHHRIIALSTLDQIG
jgi:hypothetical protein